MEELKPKKPVRRRRVMKAANAPEPTGPVGGSTTEEPMEPMASMCGHSGCTGGDCNVHYVGPTSHMRDHHIVHAARGISHVWSAAIITGLAVVVTGAIAFNAAQASSTSQNTQSQAQMKQDMAQELRFLSDRISSMENLLMKVSDTCLEPAPVELNGE
jgi:hypothetical protein